MIIYSEDFGGFSFCFWRYLMSILKVFMRHARSECIAQEGSVVCPCLE